MAYIPPEIIDEIMAKTDIVELVASYLPLTRRGKNHVGLCPFHNEDTPSFTVTQDKQIFYCFGCQKGGNAIQFIMEMESLTFPEAVRKLASRAGVTVPEQVSPRQKAQSSERQLQLRLHELAAAFCRSQLKGRQNTASAYLQRRGLSPEIAEQFQLGYLPEEDWQALYNHLSKQGYSGESMEKAGLVSRSSKNNRYYDKFHGRLIFPIMDYRGQVVAFGGRILDEGQPKYLNSTQTLIYNKSQVLYALSQAGQQIRQRGEAVIMEGYMDVLTAHQYGVTNAVASLGTAFTVEHARLLRRYTERVLLAYDGDSAGAKAAQRGLDILREQGLAVRILVLPKGQDPDDFLRAEGKAGWDLLLRDGAYDILDYLLLQALGAHDAASVAGKGAIVRDLLPAIAKTASATERESFIRKLAQELGVSVSTVYADLRKSGLRIAEPKPDLAAASAVKQPILADYKAKSQLLRLALENKNIFEKAKQELAGDFAVTEEESQLITLIEDLGADYDFKPGALFNHIPEEQEGLRQILLKLLQVDIPDEQADKLAEELILAVKQATLAEKIQEINQKLTQTAEQQELRQLLQEKTELNQRLQALKG